MEMKRKTNKNQFKIEKALKKVKITRAMVLVIVINKNNRL